jgi:hypothetical protein
LPPFLDLDSVAVLPLVLPLPALVALVTLVALVALVASAAERPRASLRRLDPLCCPLFCPIRLNRPIPFTASDRVTTVITMTLYGAAIRFSANDDHHPQNRMTSGTGKKQRL